MGRHGDRRRTDLPRYLLGTLCLRRMVSVSGTCRAVVLTGGGEEKAKIAPNLVYFVLEKEADFMWHM